MNEIAKVKKGSKAGTVGGNGEKQERKRTNCN